MGCVGTGRGRPYGGGRGVPCPVKSSAVPGDPSVFTGPLQARGYGLPGAHWGAPLRMARRSGKEEPGSVGPFRRLTDLAGAEAPGL
jgi:hypothetical protein